MRPSVWIASTAKCPRRVGSAAVLAPPSGPGDPTGVGGGRRTTFFPPSRLTPRSYQPLHVRLAPFGGGDTSATVPKAAPSGANSAGPTAMPVPRVLPPWLAVERD